ncbi:hypothetical protein IJ380_00180 [Candidatus Saccharibacteria bacterium]|nr:hypothetical protein [Candidatus Saccharibacteria bacterium]
MDVMLLIGGVILLAVLVGILGGDNRMSYEEYRRAEYRNEFLCEKRRNIYTGEYYYDHSQPSIYARFP